MEKIKILIMSRRLLILFTFLLIGIIGTLLIVPKIGFSQQTQQHIQVQLKEENSKVTCLRKGKELFFEQKYSDAIQQLEKCSENDPDNPEIYFYIAQSYFQEGQNSTFRAVRYFRQAYDVSETAIEKYWQQIENSPEEDHTNQYLRLAYIYEIRSLIPGVDEYQEAIDIYQKLLGEKPYLTHIYNHIGWIYYKQENYKNAIDNFLKYIEPGLKSDFVYYHLALSYDKIGEKEEAEHYYNLILEEFPDTEFANRAKKELN
jgi:tetratricopeptide (TPR) repeat protein